MQRTRTYEEIKPLIDLCKAGKLFEVQKWIASGKAVNGPPAFSGYKRKSPLEVAMDKGFHSLVKVLLEGGADPYAKGPDYWDEKPDPENDQNALELAAYYEHFDVFNLKQIRVDPKKPELKDLLLGACQAKKSDFLEKLLKKGFNPWEYENTGTPLIQALLTSMECYFDINHWDIWRTDRTAKRNMDNEDSRESIKMIHMLAKYGAKWLPKDRSEIGVARRSLLKMKSDYTVEFIWIMSKYEACKREDIKELIRTPAIRSVIYQSMDRVNDLLNNY